MTGFRVKEWQSFIIQNDDVFFEAIIANLKYIRFIEISFLNKKNGMLKYYIDYFPFAFWELPDSLYDSIMEYKTLGYSIKIHNYLNKNKFEFIFEIDPLDDLNVFKANFIIYVEEKKWLPLVTNLLYSEDRYLVSYKTPGRVLGIINTGDGGPFELSPENTLALVRDSKGYLPYITKFNNANGFGFDKTGKIIAFSLSENAARGAKKDNENALWSGSELTPLPPVMITHEEGFEKDWVIEDIEGMIDLSFTPQNQTGKKSFDIILAKAELANPIGVFNGMIMTKEGEKIILRNLPGYVESIYLRF